MKIYIDELTWSGWTYDGFEPKLRKQHEFEVLLNKKYVVTELKVSHRNPNNIWEDVIEEIFSFEIIEINDKFIKIKTNTDFSSKKTNGKVDSADIIDSSPNEFRLYFEEELELASNTLDMGWIYKIVLKKD